MGADNLPNGFKRLTFIQSTGTQYIDTGFKPSTRTRVVVNIKFDALPTASSAIFGARSSDTLVFMFIVTSDEKLIRSDYFGPAKLGFVDSLLSISVIDKNENIATVGNVVVTGEAVSERLECGHNLFLFANDNVGGVHLFASCKLYAAQIYDDGVLQRDFVPCKSSEDIVGLYDKKNGRFYSNVASGAFLAGDVIEAEKPRGFARRELYIDARDLQRSLDSGSPMTEEEYAAALQTRGLERLAQAQLVRSFNATVRTHSPTYEYGVDFFLGDTITVTDERLGVTVDAVVQGVERSVSQQGETLSLILGYSQPTLFDRLKRKAGN